MEAAKQEWKVGDECDVLFLARQQDRNIGTTSVAPQHILRGTIRKLGKTRVKVQINGVPGSESAIAYYCVCKPKYLARPLVATKRVVDVPETAEQPLTAKDRHKPKAVSKARKPKTESKSSENTPTKGTGLRKKASEKGTKTNTSKRGA